MSTILDEILSENATVKHAGNCSCSSCSKTQNGKHKYWRERRSARYSSPQDSCKNEPDREYEQEQFLGSILGAASKIGSGVSKISNVAGKLSGAAGKLSSFANKIPKSRIISIGNRQKAALLKQWTEKFNRARNPLVKQRYKQYIDVITKRQRPSWHQSEKDLQLFFKRLGMPGQKTFLNNQQAKWVRNVQGRYVPPKGSVVPDVNPADAMIEVKNYNIQNQDALIRALQKQIARRMQQGPKDAGGNPLDQKVILDMRGQNATWQQLNQLAQKVANKTGLAPDNVQVVTWEF